MVERLIQGVPGLQPERTDLSWTRSTASALLNRAGCCFTAAVSPGRACSSLSAVAWR